MLGDQIYIAGLIETARKTPVGKTWMLKRDQVIADLGINLQVFEELQRQLEASMPGKWDRAVSSNGSVLVYMRLM